MNNAPSPSIPPFICVHLFGPLEVLQRDADGHWQTIDKKAWTLGTPPRSVLKRLLTTPHRRLGRLDIQEDLWPEASMELADQNLSNALMVIRRIVGKDLVETTSSLCGIAGQEKIWTDLEACSLLLKEAEDSGRTTSESVRYLEEIHRYLSRGTCLEDESDRWCHAVRADAERMARQVRLWLAEGYEQAGKLWQSGEIYREQIRAAIGDEEALLTWMQMLARHGKQQEARRCYREAKDLWEAQGVTLSDASEQTIASLERVEEVKRREVTKQISTFVGSLLFTTQQPLHLYAGELLHNEEILSICTTNLPILWRFYFDGHFAEVQGTLLPEYLPQLTRLTQEPGYQKRAAALLSQAEQLAALIEKHHYNSGNALLHAKQAEYYGQVAEDLNLQIAALIQQSNIYLDLGHTWRELQAYQDAHRLTQEGSINSQISPLLLGRTYIGLAKSYGKSANYRHQAPYFLELAHKVYPEHPEADVAFNYSYHTKFTLVNHTGLTYLNIGQAEKALSTFQSAPVPTTLVPRRLEYLIRLSMSFLALGDLEQACEHTGLAATSAKMLGSDLRYHEAYGIYEQIFSRWPQEARVRELAQHFY